MITDDTLALAVVIWWMFACMQLGAWIQRLKDHA